MDWIQLHLALNHLPVVGIPLLVLLLAIGWWRKSRDVMRLVLGLIALLAAAAIAIKFTGDFAAEQSAAQLAPVKEYVGRHEQTADQVTTAVFCLGLASALALFLSRGGTVAARMDSGSRAGARSAHRVALRPHRPQRRPDQPSRTALKKLVPLVAAKLATRSASPFNREFHPSRSLWGQCCT